MNGKHFLSLPSSFASECHATKITDMSARHRDHTKKNSMRFLMPMVVYSKSYFMSQSRSIASGCHALSVVPASYAEASNHLYKDGYI